MRPDVSEVRNATTDGWVDGILISSILHGFIISETSLWRKSSRIHFTELLKKTPKAGQEEFMLQFLCIVLLEILAKFSEKTL